MLVGKRLPTSPFSHKVQKIIALNLVQRHAVWSYRLYQNLGQVDHNLHNQGFDDVICKLPIDENVKTAFKDVCPFQRTIPLKEASSLLRNFLP